MQKNNKKIYTVSQINSLIKVALEQTLPSRLIVKGEISDWKVHTSGHCYFKLKDENSVLLCVMWRSSFSKVKFKPDNGMAILATGYIDVFLRDGKYQLYVDKLEPAGVGALQLAFEQMVKKLRAEGLFDEVRKKKLPAYPERIGIITSETGAAVHDIVDSIRSRWPCVKLFLYPVPVQGEGAAKKISAALKDINKRNKQLKLDVLIVGRGGGSLEDLWAFNEERRPPRSTQGVSSAASDVYKRQVFRSPLLLVQNAEQQLDELSVELAAAMQELMVGERRRLSEAYEKVVRIEPHRLLGKKTLDLNNMLSRANIGINRIISNLRMQLTAAANRLEGLNPKSVLERGYSITTIKKTGMLIRTLEDIQVGDYLMTELAEENLIESKVTKK